MTPVQIKICGITNARDANASVEFGAQMIGLNFYAQSPRYIQPKVARQIVDALPANIHAVGIFVDGNAEEIRKIANTARVRSIQLHGNFSPETGRERSSRNQKIHHECANGGTFVPKIEPYVIPEGVILSEAKNL